MIKPTAATPAQILLVEDNPGDVDLTREALREWKFLNELTVVPDGEEAMAYLRGMGEYRERHWPDLILLDLNLPKKDGREVLSEIKSDRALRSIPVVVLSTSDADMDVIKSYGLGANCYVIKPFGIDAFMSVVESIGEFWLSVVKLPPRPLVTEMRGARAAGADPEVSRPLKRDVLTVLHVEDSTADAEFVREILTESRRPAFEVLSEGSLARAVERILGGGIDVALLDLGLPDSQGVATYIALASRFPELPVVISTGLHDDEAALAAIRAGAEDYVLKSDWDGRLLSRVLQYAVERKWGDRERRILLIREQEARSAAERALLAKDEFLAVASHELRTPVTSVAMQSELLIRLADKLGDSEQLRRIRRVIGNLNQQLIRLGKLVDNLLDISRINMGRLSLEPVDVDLYELVEDILERYRPQFIQAGCEVSLDGRPGVVGSWDRYRIEQVVTNLVNNAIKYGRGKPVEIEVGVRNGRAMLRVTDHGIGIRKEDIPRMFGSFQRIVKPTEYTGLGLGLYIVRQIIDNHRGGIRVESEPGKGSTFIVELPLKLAAHGVEPAASA